MLDRNRPQKPISPLATWVTFGAVTLGGLLSCSEESQPSEAPTPSASPEPIKQKSSFNLKERIQSTFGNIDSRVPESSPEITKEIRDKLSGAFILGWDSNLTSLLGVSDQYGDLAIPTLRREIFDQNRSIDSRAGFARLLGYINGDHARNVLLELLTTVPQTDEYNLLHRNAFQALASCADQKTADFLISAARETSRSDKEQMSVATSMILALEYLQTRPAYEAAREIFMDEQSSSSARISAAACMSNWMHYNPENAKALVEIQARNPSEELQVGIVLALARNGSPEAENLFVQIVKDPNRDSKVRNFAAYGVREIGSSSAADQISPVLQDDSLDPQLAHQILFTVIEYGSSTAVDNALESSHFKNIKTASKEKLLTVVESRLGAEQGFWIPESLPEALLKNSKDEKLSIDARLKFFQILHEVGSSKLSTKPTDAKPWHKAQSIAIDQVHALFKELGPVPKDESVSYSFEDSVRTFARRVSRNNSTKLLALLEDPSVSEKLRLLCFEILYRRQYFSQPELKKIATSSFVALKTDLAKYRKYDLLNKAIPAVLRLVPGANEAYQTKIQPLLEDSSATLARDLDTTKRQTEALDVLTSKSTTIDEKLSAMPAFSPSIFSTPSEEARIKLMQLLGHPAPGLRVEAAKTLAYDPDAAIMHGRAAKVLGHEIDRRSRFTKLNADGYSIRKADLELLCNAALHTFDPKALIEIYKIFDNPSHLFRSQAAESIKSVFAVSPDEVINCFIKAARIADKPEDRDRLARYAVVLKECQKLKITTPLRFTLTTLEGIIKTRSNLIPNQPVALAIIGEADNNGAFYNFARQFEELQRETQLLVFEVEDEKELESARIEAIRLLDSAGIPLVDDLLAFAHGSQTSLDLGVGSDINIMLLERSLIKYDPKKDLDISDHQVWKGLLDMLKPRGSAFLIGCSVGRGGEIAQGRGENLVTYCASIRPDISVAGAIRATDLARVSVRMRTKAEIKAGLSAIEEFRFPVSTFRIDPKAK